MIVVVDTNVLVVANRRAQQASVQCIENCILWIKCIPREGTIALDNGWRILKEYQDNLSSSGQPGIGDEFLRWILINRKNPSHCSLVPITPVDEQDTDFREFPSNARLVAFDSSDRKFVALSAAHPQHPPILQAVDAKWWGFKDALLSNGVAVEFICEDDIRSLSS